MPSSSEESVQEDILAYLDATLAQPVTEQAIPDSSTVIVDKVSKMINPYVAVQFGDLQQGYTHNMAGPIGDDYYLPVYTQAIGSTPKIARQVANRVRLAMIGMSFNWTGSIRKRPGGGMFPLISSNGATQAYMMPASFSVLIQYAEIP